MQYRSSRRWWQAALLGLVVWSGGLEARGHFLWLSAETRQESGETTVEAFLNEQPVADLPEYMKFIKAAKYRAEGRSLELRPGDNTYQLELSEPLPRVIDGECDLGLMTREGASFRVFYTARLQFEPLAESQLDNAEALRVSLLSGPKQLPAIRVTFAGQPAAQAQVKVYLPDGSVNELETDEEGWVDYPTSREGSSKAELALLARWVVQKPGEHEGKPYDQTRYYATFTMTDTAEPADAASGSEDGEAPRVRPLSSLKYPLLPEPLNSFGGAVLDGHLYVYSGHTGSTHRYHVGTTNPHFRRLNLTTAGASWEDLPCEQAVQGVALVGHEGYLYRTGGMMARNAEGQPHDLVSVADVSRFDPRTRTWQKLPELPEPRSTHDAAVLGHHLYVAGGWTMPGGESINASWCEGLLRLNLEEPQSGWERLESPFLRRALAAAAHDGKLYVIGGLTESSKTVQDVDLFDPSAQTWSQGPKLPGEPLQGFAPSAFSVNERLYASGASGVIYRLSLDGNSWEALEGHPVPRITHRLLPGMHEDLLIVGGNLEGKPVRTVERFPLRAP